VLVGAACQPLHAQPGDRGRPTADETRAVEAPTDTTWTRLDRLEADLETVVRTDTFQARLARIALSPGTTVDWGLPRGASVPRYGVLRRSRTPVPADERTSLRGDRTGRTHRLAVAGFAYRTPDAPGPVSRTDALDSLWARADRTGGADQIDLPATGPLTWDRRMGDPETHGDEWFFRRPHGRVASSSSALSLDRHLHTLRRIIQRRLWGRLAGTVAPSFRPSPSGDPGADAFDQDIGAWNVSQVGRGADDAPGGFVRTFDVSDSKGFLSGGSSPPSTTTRS
jgi:hypothetical protein